MKQELEAFMNPDDPVLEADAITSLTSAIAELESAAPILWGCKFNLGNRVDTFHTKQAAESYVEKSLCNGANVTLISLFTHPAQSRDSIIEEGAVAVEECDEDGVPYYDAATEDPVITQHKSLSLALQDMMRFYYEGNIGMALDSLGMVRNRIDAVSYALFQTVHRSGERG